MLTFVETAFGEILVACAVRSCFEIGHRVSGWAGELVSILIVGEVGRNEPLFFTQFRFAGWVLFLVETVVFERIPDLMFFQPGVVFFTPISGIPDSILGQFAFGEFLCFQMRDEATGVSSALVDTVAHNELTFGAVLAVVTR